MTTIRICDGCKRIFSIVSSENQGSRYILEDRTCARIDGKKNKWCVTTKLIILTR